MNKNDEIVVKHNNLIRAKINIEDVNSARILASLIAKIDNNSCYIPELTIYAKDIINSKGGENYNRIKKVIDKLVKSTVSIKYEDGPIPYYRALPFFSDIIYKKGEITAKFNDRLYDLLLCLNTHFTQYSLIEYIKLSTTYSQRLFEILKSYSKLEIKDIELKDLHKYLNTPTSHSKDFFRFRTKILEPAHKEITSKTDFYFEYEPIKGGKGGKTSPVTAVRFIFSKKKIEPVKEKKEKEDKEKTAKNNNKNFLAAWNCIKSCKGNCDTLSKKPNKAACTICKTKNLLEEVLKNQEEHCPSEKATPQKTTYKSGGIEVEQANFFEILENKNE